jgi:hypothetical protein
MESKLRVRTGRILLITVGLTLLLDALHVIALPWGLLWPVVLLIGGVAMIRWVTKPTPEARATAPAKPPAAPAERQSLALRVARVLIGIFVRS